MENPGCMTIWRDIAVRIRNKETHIRKIGGRVYRRFINTYGDLPVVVWRVNTSLEHIPGVGFRTISVNQPTTPLPVVNNRGRAYAARKRQMYRPNRKKAARAVFLD